MEEQDLDVGDDVVGPKSFALCGMAGIGKTETVIQYLHSERDKFDAKSGYMLIQVGN